MGATSAPVAATEKRNPRPQLKQYLNYHSVCMFQMSEEELEKRWPIQKLIFQAPDIEFDKGRDVAGVFTLHAESANGRLNCCVAKFLESSFELRNEPCGLTTFRAFVPILTEIFFYSSFFLFHFVFLLLFSLVYLTR